MGREDFNRAGRHLIMALSTLSVELIQEGKMAKAAKLTTVANTLKADRTLTNRLAKVLAGL